MSIGPGVRSIVVSVALTSTFTELVTESPSASVIVAVNVYDPGPAKVTVVSCAAFVPSTENLGDATPAGAEVMAHVYERPDAPAASAPSTESVVEVPVTQPLPAAAG